MGRSHGKTQKRQKKGGANNCNPWFLFFVWFLCGVLLLYDQWWGDTETPHTTMSVRPQTPYEVRRRAEGVGGGGGNCHTLVGPTLFTFCLVSETDLRQRTKGLAVAVGVVLRATKPSQSQEAQKISQVKFWNWTPSEPAPALCS